MLLRSLAEARQEERRSAAYLDAALAWHAYIDTLRPLAFPDEAFSANRHRDLASVLRSRGQLELFGSRAVQQLHEETLDKAVSLIDLLRSMPKTPTGEPDIAAGRVVVRFVLGEISKKVEALERQMNSELHNRAPMPPRDVEITGRRAPAPTAPPAHRREPSEAVPGGQKPTR
jgi:hypothetical protein